MLICIAYLSHLVSSVGICWYQSRFRRVDFIDVLNNRKLQQANQFIFHTMSIDLPIAQISFHRGSVPELHLLDSTSYGSHWTRNIQTELQSILIVKRAIPTASPLNRLTTSVVNAMFFKFNARKRDTPTIE